MEKILKISYSSFNNDWTLFQRFLLKNSDSKFEIIDDIDLTFNYKVKDLGRIVKICGTIDLFRSKIECLGSLKFVGEDINMSGTLITDIGDLEYVSGNVNLTGARIKSLNNLKYVGGNLALYGSAVETFSKLEYVGGVISLSKQNDIPKNELLKFKHNIIY